MAPAFDALRAYVGDVAHVHVDPSETPVTGLPTFLRSLYVFQNLKVGKREFLGIMPKDAAAFSPVAFIKHLRQIPLPGRDGYVLVFESLPRFMRPRLVERRIPFVVPGKQMCWPELGLDVRVRAERQHSVDGEHFDPVTQTLVIGILTRKVCDDANSREVAQQLGYSPMSIKRALDEIEHAGLISTRKVGRERSLLIPDDRKAIWERALPRMRSPVRLRECVALDDVPHALRVVAGESALSEVSMLVAPEAPTFALGRNSWTGLMERGVEILPFPEPGSCTVEVWRYEPTLFAADGRVDDFSLYLSLAASSDERVEAALSELMRGHLW